MNLTLEHATQITQQEILLVVGLIFGLAVFALVLLSFTRAWRGLVSGFLILALALGVGAFFGDYAYKSLNTSHITPDNAPRLITAAKNTYDVAITTKQAMTLLAGTPTYIPGKQVSKFGTAVLTVHDRPYADEQQAVSLVWNKTQWQLLIINSDGTYNSVQKIGATS